jgi:hypothetical protein
MPFSSRLMELLEDEDTRRARVEGDAARARGEFRDVAFAGDGGGEIYAGARARGFSPRAGNILEQTMAGDVSVPEQPFAGLPEPRAFVANSRTNRAAEEFAALRERNDRVLADNAAGRADESWLRSALTGQGVTGMTKEKAYRRAQDMLGREDRSREQGRSIQLRRDLGILDAGVRTAGIEAGMREGQANRENALDLARIQFGGRNEGPQVMDLEDGRQVVWHGNAMQVLNPGTGQMEPARVEEIKDSQGNVIGQAIRNGDGTLTPLRQNELLGNDSAGVVDQSEQARRQRRREQLMRELARVQAGGGVFVSQAARQRRMDELAAELDAVGVGPGAARGAGNTGGAAGGGSAAPARGGEQAPVYGRNKAGQRVVSRDGGKTFTLAE